MASPERHSFASSAWRFALAGGANTLITGALLSLLSLVIDARIAYTLVFAAGLVLSTFLADRFVFGVRMNWVAVSAYVALYVAVYVVGLLVVHAWTASGRPAAASGLVVVVTAPLTFLGGRLVTGTLHRARLRAASLPTTSEPQ